MIKVYLSSPFGQKFSSHEELEILLKARLFVLTSHDNNRITVERLNEQINGANGLFYYSFIFPFGSNIQKKARPSRDEHYRTSSPYRDESPKYDRVVKRVQADEDGTLILPPEVPFYFVIYSKHNTFLVCLSEINCFTLLKTY